MKFDIETFADAYQQHWPLTEDREIALNFLLSKIEAEPRLDRIQWIAYILATIKHETADTFEPIEEIGKGRLHSYGRTDAATGKAYYGRGFVMITWKRNYQLFKERLGVDLVNHPEIALEPEISWKITVEGMIHGLFTGKSLIDYINDDKTDWVNARKIINSLDKAALIAGYADKFELILSNSLI